MALTTTVATGSTDPNTGITTLDPPPANAFGIVRLDANNKFRPVPQAALGGGGPVTGTPRDIYDVPTLKRKEVVDANVAAYPEADSDYYGKVFVDEVYGPGQPAKYECLPSAPAATGGATVWKWFRIDIL